VIHPEVAEARNNLVKTHQVVPLPAYDIKRRLTLPDRQKSALAEEGGLYRLDSDPGAHRNGPFWGLDSDIYAHISDKILL